VATKILSDFIRLTNLFKTEANLCGQVATKILSDLKMKPILGVIFA
jgi:hypothetical protein